MTMWPRTCPVCRQQLPERGNRRVRVPGYSGWRLVHDGACFEAIDAQAVLDLDAKPRATFDPVVLARMRRLARQLRTDRVQLVHGTLEDLVAVARAAVARLYQPLVREEAEKAVERRREQMLELAHRYAFHEREVCAPIRTAELS